jgi:hypothetical protein
VTRHLVSTFDFLLSTFSAGGRATHAACVWGLNKVYTNICSGVRGWRSSGYGGEGKSGADIWRNVCSMGESGLAGVKRGFDEWVTNFAENRLGVTMVPASWVAAAPALIVAFCWLDDVRKSLFMNVPSS